MQLYEKKLQRIFYVLHDESGNPKLGLTPSDISFRYIKADEKEFDIKTLLTGDNGNFGEVGLGTYWTDLTAEETDVIGQFNIAISTYVQSPSPPSPLPEEIKQADLSFSIVPYPIVPGAVIPTCIIHGDVKTLGGKVTGQPMTVYSQLLELPEIIGDSFISSNVVQVYTDMEGVFKVGLAIGAIVRVEIPDAGVRRQFEVPDQTTALLKDLPST